MIFFCFFFFEFETYNSLQFQPQYSSSRPLQFEGHFLSLKLQRFLKYSTSSFFFFSFFLESAFNFFHLHSLKKFRCSQLQSSPSTIISNHHLQPSIPIIYHDTKVESLYNKYIK